ncbi:MurT ligase domain-containing protein [Patescibacteria group bacterium]|nr:MurT ligase domain-containing protein [Patescibacteria group bacterium]
MGMQTSLAIFSGKTVSLLSKTFGLGAGVTWAGEVALKIDPQLLPKLLPKEAKIILIAGTNGKTTTTKFLRSVLGEKRTVINSSGANLLNGIAGSILQQRSGKYYLLEVDENNLPLVLEQVSPQIIILLNLFRDQLDRYGEVDTVAKRWQAALALYENTLIVNADDPQLAWIGKNYSGEVRYFGLGDKKYYLPEMQHATDSIYCPKCGSRLEFAGTYLSHLGEWQCPKCGLRHPKNDLNINDLNIKETERVEGLEGTYNFYNVLAAKLAAEELGIKNPDFSKFEPAFGRSEEIRGVKILLSKNPAGFNESLRTVIGSSRKGPLYLVLNDRIPDGQDISWIWDVDFEMLQKWSFPINVGGDRVYDLALRLKYAGINSDLLRIHTDLKEGLKDAVWVLATYSAMLEVRKILTGRKIL